MPVTIPNVLQTVKTLNDDEPMTSHLAHDEHTASS